MHGEELSKQCDELRQKISQEKANLEKMLCYPKKKATKGAKWKKATVELPVARGKKVKVSGIVKGVWMVHPPKYGGDGFSITHTPSGFTLVSHNKQALSKEVVDVILEKHPFLLNEKDKAKVTGNVRLYSLTTEAQKRLEQKRVERASKRRKKTVKAKPARRLPSDADIERYGKYSAVTLHRYFAPKFPGAMSSREIDNATRKNTADTMVWIYQTLKNNRPLSMRGLYKKYLKTKVGDRLRIPFDVFDSVVYEFTDKDLNLIPGDYYKQPRIKLLR